MEQTVFKLNAQRLAHLQKNDQHDNLKLDSDEREHEMWQ